MPDYSSIPICGPLGRTPIPKWKLVPPPRYQFQIIVQLSENWGKKKTNMLLVNLCSGGIGGGGAMGHSPPVGSSAPTYPPPSVRRMMVKINHFGQNFWIFAPSEMHFTPSMPPSKKFLEPSLNLWKHTLFWYTIAYLWVKCFLSCRHSRHRLLFGLVSFDLSSGNTSFSHTSLHPILTKLGQSDQYLDH